MDTYIVIACFGDRAEDALDAAEAEILRLDTLLSPSSEESETNRLNASRGGTLSEDTLRLLQTAQQVSDWSDGCFDITIAPLVELWGFPTQQLHIPSEAELQSALSNIDYRLLQINAKSSVLSMSEGQHIDFGGIAKGYTSDRLIDIFAAYGLDCAYANLGGNVQLFGTKEDDSLWNVGIRDPRDPQALAGVLTETNCAIITSGSYERFLTDENTGMTYHHILDPHTGYPATTGLLSVTIVSTNGTLADALSTACFVLGPEKSIDLWRTDPAAFDMILITDSADIYITEGLSNHFQTELPLYIIHA